MRRYRRSVHYVLTLMLIHTWISHGQNDYIGQDKPGPIPEVFAPGIISTEAMEFAGTFSPDFTEYYFTRRTGLQSGENTIWVTRKVEDQWTAPQVAAFSGQYMDFEPHISPDGQRLYFGSRRPFEGDGPAIDMHQWYLEKADSEWTAPQPLGSPFVERFVMYPSLSNEGNIYFTGADGIYVSAFVDSQYTEPVRLGDQINGFVQPAHPFIAPDERYLIFDAQLSVQYEPGIFISYRQEDGSWTRAKDMGELISTAETEMTASVSPDGECFFFYRDEDIYWMDASIIEELKFKPDVLATPLTGHAPLTVSFSTDFSETFMPMTALQWDFDTDGTYDSQETEPVWIFDHPGTYTVTLQVHSDTHSCDVPYRDFIRVFDGESALGFDGHSGRVSCAATSRLNLTDALTIEAWINPSGWGQFPGFGLGRIVDKRTISLQLVDAFLTLPRQSLLLRLTLSNGTTSYLNTPDSSIVLDQWQHIAASYDGQGQVRIYLDGIEQPVSSTLPPSGSVLDNSAQDLSIGNDISAGNTFEGTIDEVRIWNGVRAGEEIAAGLDSYLFGDEEDLVAYWRMNEGNGVVLVDHSGHQHTATVVDASWTQGVHLNEPTNDADEDGIPDEEDNCPGASNPDQADDDGDGWGNLCDNCPDRANPGQADSDSDGSGDLCDPCTDIDCDGFGDPGFAATTCGEDNCPHVFNPEQGVIAMGDIDCDGDITILDVLAGVNHIIGEIPLKGKPLDRADCNGDGAMDVLDVVGMVNVILGISPECPGGE